MILFWVLGILLIASAVFVVAQKKPVYSVVGLLFHFAVLACFYLTLNAEFLAVIQIVVYTGAILVLFVFVIALLSSGTNPFETGDNKLPKAALPAGLLALAALGMLIYGIARSPLVAHGVSAVSTSVAGPVGAANVFGSVGDFGKALFTTHLLPFEMTAFVLMVAVIGVVALAGDATPYVATRSRARIVESDMREAILRGGEDA
ncbi:MAG: NADH-quinone oxidoreductase subunit J [Candidatus Eremiobacteraeota bacterium]|nr:NADH-quinone oxidoreductase subunit J [Candidatus Eremiobacteraeota bacterium]